MTTVRPLPVLCLILRTLKFDCLKPILHPTTRRSPDVVLSCRAVARYIGPKIGFLFASGWAYFSSWPFLLSRIVPLSDLTIGMLLLYEVFYCLIL